MQQNKSEHSLIKYICLTPLFFLISHYLVVFMHEYAHATVAWLLSYKVSPLDINYGGSSLANILFLVNIDQQVNNQAIYQAGHAGHVALIAAAGPGLVILLYFMITYLLQKNYVFERPLLMYFLFFVCLWCLGGTYAYVPIRTFTPHGVMIDVLDIEQSLSISPWIIYAVIGYLVFFMFWLFFRKVINNVYQAIGLETTGSKATLMILCVLTLFGYCGLAGLSNHGEISHFLSLSSLLIIPIIIWSQWPSRTKHLL